MNDEFRLSWRERAEAAGIPLKRFIEIEEKKRLAHRLTMDEIEARIRARGPSNIPTEETVRIIRELRGD